MGFDRSQFQYFPKTKDGISWINANLIQKKVDEVDRVIVASKKVKEYASKHFGCDNIEGIELEN